MNKYKGLYIHIPFCKQKCKYCDFISYTDKEDIFDEYINRLRIEASEYKGAEIDTIFIGGGTPSLLSCEQFTALTEMIKTTFILSDDCEFTIEANPKTLDTNKLKTLKSCGVNRISLGVQSFCDEELKAIGRIHDAKTAYNTVELIKEHGFENFNIDIMLNLPNQTKESLLNTLETAISLNPSHISCYSLILEENTPLFNEYETGKFELTSDEYDRELYTLAKDTLSQNGYCQYEISNFSKEGFKSRHNLKYWNCDEYIGLGVAAHSHLNGIRFYNSSEIQEYINGFYHKEETLLKKEDKISEYIIMRLRLTEGIPLEEFKKRFNIDFYEKYKELIDKFVSAGFMKCENNSYRLTDSGFNISNSIMCEFV